MGLWARITSPTASRLQRLARLQSPPEIRWALTPRKAGSGCTQLHDRLRARHAVDHRGSIDHHGQQRVSSVWSSESDLHSKLRNPGERGYPASLTGTLSCTSTATATSCRGHTHHLLGTDLDQLQHHLRARNVDGHGGRAGAHTEPDCVGLYLAFGCNHGFASGHCLQHGRCRRSCLLASHSRTPTPDGSV